MEDTFDRRRVTIFVALAFGLSWTLALVIYLTGGLANSPVILPDLGLTLAYVLIVTGYMIMPALAHVLTRLITREGWKDTYLRLKLRVGWRYWLVMWVLPGILTLLGMWIYFTVFPDQADFTLSTFVEADPRTAELIDMLGVPALIALQTLLAMAIAPIANSVATFGEEFGWRAYLQPKLMALGPRKAVLMTGVIWGVWHWPVILMGHNYGLDYPGAPFVGPLMMVVFTVVVGIIIGWATIRGQSVWPAVIGHGALNGIASLGLLFLTEKPHILLGPAPTGLLGMIPWIIVAGWIMLRADSFVIREAQSQEALPSLKE